MEISSFYTSVPKTMIIRYIVPEMRRETNVIVIFILGYTFPFYSSNSPKNENFKTMKTKPGYIIILHYGTKNHDQMLYYSWDIACVRCNCYCSFWAIFSPFTPLTAQKKKTWKMKKKKKKNTWRYHNLAQVYQKSWSYAILLLRYGTCQM